MSKKLEIWLAAILAIAFIAGPLFDTTQPVPDFAAMQDINVRKQAFINYLKPAIDKLNRQRTDERQELKALYADLLAGKQPGQWQRKRLQLWSERYDVKFQPDQLTAVADKLLLRLDRIPTSMVLAQAALESAWGTSRFLQEGNNLFGQWCFTKGCGITPGERGADAKHEVKRFTSVEESLHQYFRNINSHSAYQPVRNIRAQARKAGKPLSGLAMINGLSKYSAKGQAYIDELRSIIRYNNFE